MPYLKAGLKIVGLTLLFLPAASAVGYGWPILTSVMAVAHFIDQENLKGTLALLLALAGYTVTVVLIAVLIEIWREFYRGWMYDAKEAMSSLRRAELADRIASLPVIYRRYTIYPKLKIYRDWDGY